MQYITLLIPKVLDVAILTLYWISMTQKELMLHISTNVAFRSFSSTLLGKNNIYCFRQHMQVFNYQDKIFCVNGISTQKFIIAFLDNCYRGLCWKYFKMPFWYFQSDLFIYRVLDNFRLILF